MLAKIITFAAISAISCTPPQNPPKETMLQLKFSLPEKLREVSGIALSSDQKNIFAIEDKGNKSQIFVLDLATGAETGKVKINAENNDWEDITKDAAGNFYIGDFGNNDNDRQNLRVLKTNLKNASQPNAEITQTTDFHYEGQTDFPPKKSERLYDCEAFIEKNGNFYLFTKNRSSHFDGTFLIFKIPNRAGNFEAKLIGKIKLGGEYKDSAITSAALSPDGSQVVLLSHRNIFVLSGFGEDNFNGSKIKKIALNSDSQKEGICFFGKNKLLIADEKDGKTGGNLYTFTY